MSPLGQRPPAHPESTPKATSLSRADFDFVRDLVRERAAIVLDDGKAYLAETRLKHLARSTGYADLGELVAALREGLERGLPDRVVDAMTTNETSFFRDLQFFEILRRDVIPALIERNAERRTLKFWCGAAATGQEAYSVLMMLDEHFPQLAGWTVDFLATDINREVLDRARRGEYSQFEINRGLPAALLVKNFVNDGGAWRIGEEFRRGVRFERMNLIGPWRWLRDVDIVFLRNVLIYFDLDVKRRVLARVRQALSPDGYLFLGGAESILNVDQRWTTVLQNGAAYYRPEGPTAGAA